MNSVNFNFSGQQNLGFKSVDKEIAQTKLPTTDGRIVDATIHKNPEMNQKHNPMVICIDGEPNLFANNFIVDTCNDKGNPILPNTRDEEGNLAYSGGTEPEPGKSVELSRKFVTVRLHEMNLLKRGIELSGEEKAEYKSLNLQNTAGQEDEENIYT